MAKGKFQLQIAHYFPGDHYLEAGTIVGDGTDFPVEGPPSLNMTPLDETAREEIIKYNTDRKRPDIPVPPLNPTGANLAAGPGQVITTSLSSGPPRNEGANRVPGPPGYNEGAPAIRGTPIGSQRLGPTELKIQEERAAIEEEDRRAAEDASTNAALSRAKGAARGAAMIPADELVRRKEAEEQAARDAEQDKKDAAERQSAPGTSPRPNEITAPPPKPAAPAPRPAITPAAPNKPLPAGEAAKPSVPTGTAGAAQPATQTLPGQKPTIENSLPKPG